MGNVYYTSDLHLFHKSVAWLRVYGTWPTEEERATINTGVVGRHNAELAANWDDMVGPNDHVWVMGDLIGDEKHLDPALQWVRDRPGTKHIVFGNHDPAHPSRSRSHIMEKLYPRAFQSAGATRTRKIAMPDGTHRKVLLSHFPYQGDHEGKADRYTQYRLPDEGVPLIHGHVHTRNRVTFTSPNHTPQIHVGVDAWDMAPVHSDRVAQLIHDFYRNDTANEPLYRDLRSDRV